MKTPVVAEVVIANCDSKSRLRVKHDGTNIHRSAPICHLLIVREQSCEAHSLFLCASITKWNNTEAFKNRRSQRVRRYPNAYDLPVLTTVPDNRLFPSAAYFFIRVAVQTLLPLDADTLTAFKTKTKRPQLKPDKRRHHNVVMPPCCCKPWRDCEGEEVEEVGGGGGERLQKNTNKQPGGKSLLHPDRDLPLGRRFIFIAKQPTRTWSHT